MTDKKNFEDMAVRGWNKSEESFAEWVSNFLFCSRHKDELYENAVQKRRGDVFPELDKLFCTDVSGLIIKFVGYE